VGILDVFSKRNTPPPDVYSYDELPNKLRVQIVHLLEGAMGREWSPGNFDGDGWAVLAKSIAREHGLLEIPSTRSRYSGANHFTDCMNYILQADAPLALDLVEVAIRVLDQKLRDNPYHQREHGSVDGALAELNHRFRENGVGFQYEGGQIVRVDAQLIHSGADRPMSRCLE
jgi:hypothetical protein